MAKPSTLKVLIIIELFIAVLGVASGIGLLSDPSGKGMGLDVVKDKIPFQSLTLLGLWFLGPYGLLPGVLAYGFYRGRLWAWRPALVLAVVMVAWVLVQIPMVGRSVLQAIFGAIAVASIILLYRPSVLDHLE